MLNRLAFCLLCLIFSNGVSAIGLGDLNRQPVLGERLEVEINITGAAKEALDASCYRLKQPGSGDDIPWLKTAFITLRKGPQPVLEIRSSQIVHDPILAMAVHVACGQEIVREYMLLASPAREAPPLPNLPTARINLPQARPNVDESVAPQAAEPMRKPTPRRLPQKAANNDLDSVIAKKPSRQASTAAMSTPGGVMSDRLMISAGGEVGDPSLHMSSELASLNERIVQVNETQHEMLRLEFRMLLALQEQAMTQLEASEKLRNLDKALLDLQQNAAAQEKKEAAVPVAPVPVPVAPAPPAAVVEESLLDEWGLYAVLLLALVGAGGWLGWKNLQERRMRALQSAEYVALEPVSEDDPELDEESASRLVAMDLDEPAETGEMMQVDLHLDDTEQTAVDVSLAETPYAPASVQNGIESATLDERFEANPVMELADIMLSFGRVKGAAQALQEYIDANPQEALQPWMRLLDVYRMAGMRAEFEELALNLNKNFNVEIQHWEQAPAAKSESNEIDFVLDDISTEVVQPPRAEHIEEMPRIMEQIVARWSDSDISSFIYDLLRDNRGGARVGFSLGVVEEMLFLIELKETIAQSEREAKAA